MAEEPALIRLLREAVEEEVTASLASTVLFAALTRWGSRIPQSFVEVVEFVDGPLKGALADHLGAERAATRCRAIERRLRFAELPTGVVSSAAAAAFEEPTTRSMPQVKGAVALRVLSGTPTLALVVVSTLGAERVRGVDAGENAAVLLVDATDPPSVSDEAVVAEARRAPLTVVWGTDADDGARLLAALRAAGVEPLGLDSEEGVGPLLDLLRSRAG